MLRVDTYFHLIRFSDSVVGGSSSADEQNGGNSWLRHTAQKIHKISRRRRRSYYFLSPRKDVLISLCSNDLLRRTIWSQVLISASLERFLVDIVVFVVVVLRQRYGKGMGKSIPKTSYNNSPPMSYGCPIVVAKKPKTYSNRITQT